MIGHVGSKVSALIDGQLPSAESERLWSHVHMCGACRALVEREGWVKTRLAGLALCGTQPAAPNYLSSLLCAPAGSGGGDHATRAPAKEYEREHERRRAMVAAALGAGSIGAALCGVLILTVPAEAPVLDRRGPVTSLTGPSISPRTVLSRTGSPTRTPPGDEVNVGQVARVSVPLAK